MSPFLSRLVLPLILALSALGQTPNGSTLPSPKSVPISAPNSSVSLLSSPVLTVPGVLDYDVATQQAFDAVYWASQPPAIQAAFGPSTAPSRWLQPGVVHPAVTSAQAAGNALLAQAVALAQAGYTVDPQIDLWGWDPYTTQLGRVQGGYTWVPSLLQPGVKIAPGLNEPGFVPYNPSAPPAGSIKVSINPADYPAWPVPPPPLVVARSPVGPLLTGNTFLANMPESAPFKNGQAITVSGRVFVFSFPTIFSQPSWIGE